MRVASTVTEKATPIFFIFSSVTPKEPLLMTTLFLLPVVKTHPGDIPPFAEARRMTLSLPVLQPADTSNPAVCDCSLPWDRCATVHICAHKPRKPAAALHFRLTMTRVHPMGIIIIDIIDIAILPGGIIIIDVIERILIRVFAIIIIDVADAAPVMPTCMNCVHPDHREKACLNSTSCFANGCARQMPV